MENKGFYPEDDFEKENPRKKFLNIYKIYQQKLIDLNSADFSDLTVYILLKFLLNITI